jgi:hypothetical protein
MALTTKIIKAAARKLFPAKGGVYTIESFETIFKLKLGHTQNANTVFIGLNSASGICIFVKGTNSEFKGLPLSKEFQHDEWDEAGGKFEALMISDLPTHLHHLMDMLIINLSNHLESTTKKLGAVDLTQIIKDSLASEIESTGMMSNSLRIGLFGELILLKYLLGASKPKDYISVLNLWTGPGKAKRDYLTKQGFVEVKTTGTTNRIHQINDPGQLRLKGKEKKGYLFSVKAKSDDSGTLHLVELINEIRSKLTPLGLETMFDGKLENYGGPKEGFFRALEPAYKRMKKYLYDSTHDAFYELTDDYRMPIKPPLALPPYVELDGYNLNLVHAPQAVLKSVLKWMLT